MAPPPGEEHIPGISNNKLVVTSRIQSKPIFASLHQNICLQQCDMLHIRNSTFHIPRYRMHATWVLQLRSHFYAKTFLTVGTYSMEYTTSTPNIVRLYVMFRYKSTAVCWKWESRSCKTYPSSLSCFFE